MDGKLSIWDLGNFLLRHTCVHPAGVVELKWLKGSPMLLTCAVSRELLAICAVSAAASRTMLAASPRLNIAQPAVAPISPIIASTKASLRASSAAAAFISTARRAFGPIAAHAG